MCKKYKYVGFSGFVVDNTGENEVPNKFIKIFIEEAHKNGAKVHGFGYTRASISNLGFDSVDSSSWISGVKFGSLFEYKNGRMTVKKKRVRNFNKEAYPKIIDINMREWVKYQKDLDKK